MRDAKVLIAGAGPTGLVLALFLERHGLRARIVDRRSGPGEASRAMAVQARTLEFYRQLGFGDEVAARGIKVRRVRVWERREQVATFELGDIGAGISPYPFALSFPQDEHERFLVERLSAAGIEVEWNTELVGFDDRGDRVEARLSKDGAEETVDVAYLCGCDGANSRVRQELGLGFPGGTYEQVFFVADVVADGEAVDNEDLNGCLEENGFLVVFPIRTTGMHRLIGLLPKELEAKEDVAFEDVRPHVESLVDARVTKVNWFSRYRSHHRVADRFRVGRVFIAGDAGHIHSPAGGQGMNTGIGDAVNLAWKLAAVADGRADAALLDTYEPERIAFARTLVSTTDRAFKLVAGRGLSSRLLRDAIAPFLAPFAFGFRSVRRAAFRLVSQTRIEYRESPLSAGAAGDVHGGDRLPWASEDGTDSFAPLRSLDWQVHVYGRATEALRAACEELRIPLHELSCGDATDAAGLARDALYLVRPDGYVGLADADQDVGALRAYVGRFGIGPRV